MPHPKIGCVNSFKKGHLFIINFAAAASSEEELVKTINDRYSLYCFRQYKISM